ncbi:SLATT domain-containing protein [Accumulibacter sp.]|uniref:SLATT domain-containing protein n=1 Tax=Accumulibacter sp. TaxID=2053492 RepID=UPI0026381616|nr:SLATT domain-containing protein [Accumulibacter sp.]
MSTLPPASSRDIRPREAFDQESGNEQQGDCEALQMLAADLEKRAVEAADWYLRNKIWPRRLSRLLRFLAILFGILGGLAPLVGGAYLFGDAGNGKPALANATQWGYILIALAAASMLFDRYFGFSSSWMRYMTAQMALQRSLEKFQLSWRLWRIKVSGTQPSDEQQAAAIGLLTAFQQEVGDLVEQEFQAWIAQFKEQLAELQAAIDKDKAERRPGNLVVGIHSATAISGPAEIYLDNRLVRRTDSGSVLLSALNPGSHLVVVKANAGTWQGSATVSVQAGETSEANIELKAIDPATGDGPQVPA